MAPAEPVGFSYLWPGYQILCVFAILGALLPAPAHWRAGNDATLFLTAWILIANVIILADTIKWRGKLDNPSPVWCDITSVFYTMLACAIATSTLAIQYKLWAVASNKSVFITKAEKRRQRAITWFLGLGWPLVMAVLHFIFQRNRFDIVEDVGCMGNIVITDYSIAFYYSWEPIFCFISVCFALRTIHLFLKQRNEFDAVLAPNISNVTMNHYVRLLALAGCEVVIHLPVSLWLLITSCTQYTRIDHFYWSQFHNPGFKRVRFIPRILVDASPSMRMLLGINLWCIPAVGLIYFVFFGFGEEAVRQYKWMAYLVVRPFGIKPPEQPKSPGPKMKRTWLDIIMGRPGHPMSSASGGGSSLPQFTSGSRSEGNAGIDIENLDFLNPAAVKQRKLNEAEAIRIAAQRRDSLATSDKDGSTSGDEKNEKEKKKVDLEANTNAVAGPSRVRDPACTEQISF